MTQSFERLFNPRGIAIIGASSDPSRIGYQPLAAIAKSGYVGGKFPVNPKYTEIEGHKCYASVNDIAGPCDVAVIAVAASQAPMAIKQCGEKGIKFAVVLGGGFRETGEKGAALEEAMIAAAKAGGVRIIGPNCTGLLNVHTGVIAAFGTLTRPPILARGSVSAVVQSSGFGLSLVVRCALAKVGFRCLVTSGNEADISASELIEAYIEDSETKVILAYLEGVNDGRRFMDVAKRALAASKPLIVFKSGNTEQGKRAAASHTANLTGSYDIYKAAFHQCGIVEARDVDETVDFALCLTSGRLPKGRNVALMGGSGGSAAVFSDAASDFGLTLGPLNSETTAVLRSSFPSMGSFSNPIDYTAGYPRVEEKDKYLAALKAVFADPGVDQLALMLTTLERNRMKLAAELLVEAAATSDKPVMVFMAMSEEIVPEAMEIFRSARIPVIYSPRRIAAAMGMLADYADVVSRRHDVARKSGKDQERQLGLASEQGSLSEYAGKLFLEKNGIPVTADKLLPLDLKDDLAGIKFPVAVKIVSKDIAHKTDIGGVRLNVGGIEQLREAARSILENVSSAAPKAKLDGLLVSQMITDGTEMLIGVVNDEGFGPVVALGIGGVLAEVVKDTTYRIAPFGFDDAHAMINELRAKAVLEGVRGEAAKDIDALAEILVRVSNIAWGLRDHLIEMDINPLLVRPKGLGAVAADALITLRNNP